MEAYKEYKSPTGITKIGLYLTEEELERLKATYAAYNPLRWIETIDELLRTVSEAEK